MILTELGIPVPIPLKPIPGLTPLTPGPTLLPSPLVPADLVPAATEATGGLVLDDTPPSADLAGAAPTAGRAATPGRALVTPAEVELALA